MNVLKDFRFCRIKRDFWKYKSCYII